VWIRFGRQRPIDEFIVDFYCKKIKLAIELDGITHDFEDTWQKDQIRQKRLELLGVNFLRFTDDDVRQNLEGVLIEIRRWIQTHPRPLQGGE
jgi:very-short-patch-repair endonuclease